MYPDSPNNNPTNNPNNNPTDNPNPPLVRLQLDKLLVLENSSGKLQIYIWNNHNQVKNQSIKQDWQDTYELKNVLINQWNFYQNSCYTLSAISLKIIINFWLFYL